MPTNVVERTTISGKLSDIEQRVTSLERNEMPTGAYATGVDVLPDGDARGLWTRMINRAGLAGYTTHHRAGSQPTAFSWATSSGFGGAAETEWNRLGSFMRWEMIASPHFLYDAIGTYDQRQVYARLRVGSAAEFGLRIDDGGTANYAEIVLDPDQAGGYVIDFRHKKAGAAETEVSGPTLPATEFTVVLLRYDEDRVWARLMAEEGDEVPVPGWDSGTVSWTPSRVGFVGRGATGASGPVVSDWIYTTFE